MTHLSQEFRALLVLALPVTLSQLAQYALALVNTAVIGRVSAQALATAAYATAIYYLIFMVLQGTLLAVAPHVAQAHGAGNREGVARALVGGLKLAALLALLATPLLWGAAYLLEVFAPSGIDAPLAAAYLRVYALAMLPVLSFSVLRGTMEALGQPGRWWSSRCSAWSPRCCSVRPSPSAIWVFPRWG
jgi:MATE family multidrug resistance protein